MASTLRADDVLAATQGVRRRSIALLRPLGEAASSTVVPTCPQWTVKQLACHLFGVCDDLLNGRLDGVGTDAWTLAQLARHEAKPLTEILDEWEASADPFDALVPLIPAPSNARLVMDQVTHEQDLRLALGAPGARDDVAVTIGATYMLEILGDRDPAYAHDVATSGLSDFELLRALSGRRSASQLDACGLSPARLAALLSTTPMSITVVDVDELAV